MNFSITVIKFKRKILISVLLFLSSFSILAQERNSSQVSIGFSAGLNHSTFKFDERSMRFDLPEYSKSKLGIGLGIVVNVPMFNNLSFQPEYIWNSMGGGIKELDSDYRLNYLSFPVLLNWRILPKVSVVGGPQFDLLINARLKKSGETNDVTKEIENRGINGLLGIKYDLTDSISINGRYIYGLNHIGFQLQTVNPEYKNRLIQLSLIYSLSL